MTQMAHRACGEEYGCVVSSHTEIDCYWRYVDNTWETFRDVFVMTRFEWEMWSDDIRDTP